jgi:hypothetical protein
MAVLALSLCRSVALRPARASHMTLTGRLCPDLSLRL